MKLLKPLKKFIIGFGIMKYNKMLLINEFIHDIG